MSSQGGSRPLQCPCCKKCAHCTDLEEIFDVTKAGFHGLTIRGEHVNKKINLGTVTTGTQHDFILQNTKNDEISSVDFITDFEQYELNCPRCKKILQNAKKLLQSVSAIDRKQLFGVCIHCHKKKSFKMCHKFDKTEKEETIKSVNTKLAQVTSLSKVIPIRDNERGSKLKYSVKSDSKIDKINKASSDLQFEQKIRQLIQSKYVKNRTPILDMVHDISDFELNSSIIKPEKISFERTCDLSEQYQRYSIAENQFSLDTFTRVRETHTSNIKIQDSLFAKGTGSTKLVPSQASQARKIHFILKSEEETLSQDTVSDSEEYLYLKKERLKLKSNLVRSHRISDNAIRVNEIPTRRRSVIREYHSEEALPASLTNIVEHELGLNIIYFPIQEQKNKELPVNLKSSVELIKDTQDMLRIRNEETERKKGEEKKRSIEEKEKKRIAREEKKNFENLKKILAEEEKKKLAEEVTKTSTLITEKLQDDEHKYEKGMPDIKPSEIKEGKKIISRTTSEKGKEFETKEINTNKVAEEARLEIKKERKGVLQKNKDKLQEENLKKEIEKREQTKEKEERFYKEKGAKQGEEKAKIDKFKKEEKLQKEKVMKELKDGEKTKEKEELFHKEKGLKQGEVDKAKIDKSKKDEKLQEERVMKGIENREKTKEKEEWFHKEKGLKQGEVDKAKIDKSKKDEKLQEERIMKGIENREKTKEKEEQFHKENVLKQREGENTEIDKSKKEKGLEMDISKKVKNADKDNFKRENLLKSDTSIRNKANTQKQLHLSLTNEAKRWEKENTKQNKLNETDKLAQEKFKQLLSQQLKEQENELKMIKQTEAELKKAQEIADKKSNEDALRKIKEDADKRAKEGTDIKSRVIKTEQQNSEYKIVAEPTREISIRHIKTLRKPSLDDTALGLVKLKQDPSSGQKGSLIDPSARQKAQLSNINSAPYIRKQILRDDADLAFYDESFMLKNEQDETLDDIIVGHKICNKYKHVIEEGERKPKEEKVIPVLFKSTYEEKPITVQSNKMEEKITVEVKHTAPILLPRNKSGTVEPQEYPKGVIRYALSDRSFIEKGWTMLPTEKVVRKMNVYRMRPAHPEFDWFARNKNKRYMEYDTGEKLAEFDDNGRGRWYYRNGRLALDYYDAEEINAQQRFVIYSSGEPDDRGRTHPVTVLASFDYLGNGIVFDHTGKIRLKYNQTEGVLLDRNIGPVSNWKWHTLNDPPVLQQVMIDTQMPHKDPRIIKMGSANEKKPKLDNEEMLAIEFDNFIKEKSKKLSQIFKPFQIKMKAMKINEHFSLRVLDQASIYLIYRDGSTNLKLNIGMILDHKEIVDTDSAEVGEVSISLEHLPARTDSLAGLQRNVANAQRVARLQAEHKRRLQLPQTNASADQLTAGTSKPLRLPFRTGPSNTTVTAGECHCKSKMYCPNDLYYDTGLF